MRIKKERLADQVFIPYTVASLSDDEFIEITSNLLEWYVIGEETEATTIPLNVNAPNFQLREPHQNFLGSVENILGSCLYDKPKTLSQEMEAYRRFTFTSSDSILLFDVEVPPAGQFRSLKGNLLK